MTARNPTCFHSMWNRCANSSLPPKDTASNSHPTTCANGSKQRWTHYRSGIPTPMKTRVDEFPITALTQRPMAMYHSWGSQNAWLRQLHGHNPLYIPTKLMREHGLQDEDWVKVTSPHGEITVPVLEMAALNENTIWTWNAIGKRKGDMGPGRGRTRSHQRVLAQPPDPRTLAPQRGRAAVGQL